MAIWEYKVISSGKGGFATPAMLEKFLGDLGKEEWEIISFRTPPDQPLAFNGLARRSTQRDWTLEDAAASAAKVEADKLRAEFEAKFKGVTTEATAEGEKTTETVLRDTDDGYRSPVDTTHDLDPDAEDEESRDDWDKLGEDDELPTFFEAIRPHMRRNQRGQGMSVGVDFLAKKWGFDDAEIIGALVECGFVMPEDEDSPTAYLEYDGDLFWVNINRRGELWINTKEKPMPVFRTVAGQPIEVEEEPKSKGKKKKTAEAKGVDAAKKSEPSQKGKSVELPKGEELLSKIRPNMRRNRHGKGHAGSMTFLSRAFKCSESDLLAAFIAMGLTVPEKSGGEPIVTDIGAETWWLNKDPRGAIWINGCEKETGAAKADAAAAPNDILSAARPLLKTGKTSASAELGQLAEKMQKPSDDLLAALVALGLKVPEKPRQKPHCVDRTGESFWLSLNTKAQLVLHSKASIESAEKAEAKAKATEPETKVEDKPEDTKTKPVAKKAPAKKSRGPRVRKTPADQAAK